MKHDDLTYSSIRSFRPGSSSGLVQSAARAKSGCGTRRLAPRESLCIHENSRAGSESREDLKGLCGRCRGDILMVNVWREQEVSQRVTVRPDGGISLPLANEVGVSGMTPTQIEVLLTEKLKSFLAHLMVTVSVAEIHSKMVYITGEVGKPGAYPLLAPTTVMQLVATAGGLTQYSKGKNIYILRSERGREMRYGFNYQNYIRGRNGEQNITLRPGDTGGGSLRQLIATRRIYLLGVMATLLALAATVLNTLAQEQQGEVGRSSQGNGGRVQEGQATSAEQARRYTPTLNSDRLVALEGGRGSYMPHGGTLAAGYYDNILKNAGLGQGAVSIVDGHIGLQGLNPRNYYLIQYGTVAMPYSNPDLGNQALHRVSFLVGGGLGAAGEWNLKFSSSYGKRATRLLASFNYIPLGNVPTVDSTFAAFGGGNGDILTSSERFNLRRQLGRRRSIALSLGHSYFDFINFKKAGTPSVPISSKLTNPGSGEVTYEFGVGLRTTLQAFGQVARFFARPQCTSYGGGIGFSAELDRKTRLALSGGPQISSGSCARTQGADCDATLSKEWDPGFTAYLTAHRDARAAYPAGQPLERQRDGRACQAWARGDIFPGFGVSASQSIGSQVAYEGYFGRIRQRGTEFVP